MASEKVLVTTTTTDESFINTDAEAQARHRDFATVDAASRGALEVSPLSFDHATRLTAMGRGISTCHLSSTLAWSCSPRGKALPSPSNSPCSMAALRSWSTDVYLSALEELQWPTLWPKWPPCTYAILHLPIRTAYLRLAEIRWSARSIDGR